MSKPQGFRTKKGRAVKQIRAASRQVGKSSAIVAEIAEANLRITAIRRSGRPAERVTALGTVVSKYPEDNWTNDAIQFPRLLAELQMAGAITTQVMNDLRESMDLNDTEICQLLDRADRKWEAIKEVTPVQ